LQQLPEKEKERFENMARREKARLRGVAGDDYRQDNVGNKLSVSTVTCMWSQNHDDGYNFDIFNISSSNFQIILLTGLSPDLQIRKKFCHNILLNYGELCSQQHSFPI
jgi:hypothetical protein